MHPGDRGGSEPRARGDALRAHARGPDCWEGAERGRGVLLACAGACKRGVQAPREGGAGSYASCTIGIYMMYVGRYVSVCERERVCVCSYASCTIGRGVGT